MTNQLWDMPATIHSFSGDFGVTIGAITGGSSPASGAFPAANDAYFIPFYLSRRVLIKQLFVVNGNTASGNFDVGVYSKDGSKIVSAGSTAQSGTGAPQFVNIADTVLAPGAYYWAVALDGTTGTLFRANLNATFLKCAGLAKMATAFALPATATLATMDQNYLPLVGAEIFRAL